MRRRLNKWGFIILASFSLMLIGCKEGIPDDVIQPLQMENLLYDFHLAKSMAEKLPQDKHYQRKLYYESVFEKHGVEQAEFDSSMVWYTRHTEELRLIYDNVARRLHKEQDQINHLIAIRDNKPKESAAGDSIDVWVGNRLYVLTASAMLNKVVFEIPADNQFNDNDWFVWRLRSTSLPFHTVEGDTAFAVLSAKYYNDSIVSVTKQLTGLGRDSLILRNVSSYKVNKLKGYIYYQGDSRDRSMLIDEISLTRYRYVEEKGDSVKTVDTLVPVKKEQDEVKLQRTSDTLIQQSSSQAISPETVKQAKAEKKMCAN